MKVSKIFVSPDLFKDVELASFRETIEKIGIDTDDSLIPGEIVILFDNGEAWWVIMAKNRLQSVKRMRKRELKLFLNNLGRSVFRL